MTTATGAWPRVTAWLKGLSGKAADVLPVRVGGTDYRPTRSTPAAVLGFDQALLWVVVALLAWGRIAASSSSWGARARGKTFRHWQRRSCAMRGPWC